jgi:hypothetical protein
MYDICKEDFADHVRHATSFTDLAIRCGCGNDASRIQNSKIISELKKKTINMKLNIDHFWGPAQDLDDDIFIKIVKESDCPNRVAMKCVSVGDKSRSSKYIQRRIKDLCIDTSHWKMTSKWIRPSKMMNSIDDETFKTIVKNSINWNDIHQKCGYKGRTTCICTIISNRIKMLGLDTNHFDQMRFDNDKIFVAESQYRNHREIKKRLVCEFDRPYECTACKNKDFTTRDGVLMWNDQEIVLQLEHINGVHNDNRLENLEFLCANCHSQTNTFCGRNNKKYKVAHAWIEDGITEHKPGSIGSLLN